MPDSVGPEKRERLAAERMPATLLRSPTKVSTKADPFEPVSTKVQGRGGARGLDVIATQVGRSQDVPRGRLQEDYGFAGDGSCAGYQTDTRDGSGSARGRSGAGGDFEEVLVNELL